MYPQSTLKKSEFLLGNEAIALAAVYAGIRFAASYPGTPSSEILPAFFKAAKSLEVKVEGGWMINEKVAFEAALAASWSGIPSMVSMKQVGLNVATDPLMSAAYTGTKAPFIVVSVDDPGPHSSQTEQDSRFHAMFAKIPVLDPSSPKDAFRMVFKAFLLSQEFEIPVMIRPVLRVAHSRESVEILIEEEKPDLKFEFVKDTARWAATPKFRYKLHKELNQKLKSIATLNSKNIRNQLENINNSKRIFIASGAMYSYAWDLGLFPLIKIDMPYPLEKEILEEIVEKFEEIWILEETYPVIEIQFPERRKIKGKLSGHIPLEGEIDLELLNSIIREKRPQFFHFEDKKPRLCPGCGHRPVFYAIKKLFPTGIYPGDIGCYTLGINLGAVDTCLCMGAAVSMGLGFSKALKLTNEEKPIISTIGDSTFLHAGIPPLIEAVEKRAKMVLVILDNRTTAMTGGQPVHKVDFKKLIAGCGVKNIQEAHAYNFVDLCDKLKSCCEYSLQNEEVSVLICHSPCVIYGKTEKGKIPQVDFNLCTNCGICYEKFECPAIIQENKKAKILEEFCTGCGVCEKVCPKKAIKS